MATNDVPKTFEDLRELEKKLVLLLRQLKPFERITIQLADDKPGRVSVVVSSTVKEVFAVDKL